LVAPKLLDWRKVLRPFYSKAITVRPRLLIFIGLPLGPFGPRGLVSWQFSHS